MMDKLFTEIELLRRMMVNLVIKKGVNDPEVLKLSQELDELIAEYYEKTCFKYCIK